MSHAPHIIIIGAGLIGLSTAGALAEKGARVTVIERGTSPMGGASYANSGMVHLSQASPWLSVIAGPQLDPEAGTAVLDLARRSASLIAANAKRFDLPMTKRSAGCLQIFRNTDSWKWAQEHYDHLGVTYRRQPAGGVLGDRPALMFPDDRSGDAHAYGMALAASLSDRGVQIQTGKAAELLMEGACVRGVVVDGREIKADHIILAAGAQSGVLAKTANVDLPIKPVAGYSLTYLLPDGLNLPAVPVMDGQTRSCLTVFGNRVRLSGTVKADSADDLIAIWDDLIPGLSARLGAPITAPWRGERPMSLTGKPLIGRTAVPGLWINAGHAHMGWTLCAGSGALCADMVMDGAADARFSVPSLTPAMVS
jgi:D-amino-acid dehydrogenase